MTQICFFFVEMDFPRGRGSSGKIVEFPGGGGENGQTLWNGKSRGVGGQTGKTLRGGGYGYFLEPHNGVMVQQSLQYCAKVMQANFPKFPGFSRKFHFKLHFHNISVNFQGTYCFNLAELSRDNSLWTLMSRKLSKCTVLIQTSSKITDLLLCNATQKTKNHPQNLKVNNSTLKFPIRLF